MQCDDSDAFPVTVLYSLLCLINVTSRKFQFPVLGIISCEKKKKLLISNVGFYFAEFKIGQMKAVAIF